MRLSVVWIVVGVLVAGTVRAQDVLVIRNGTRRQGVVSGCRDDACTLDGAKVARGLIAWVGLRQGDAAPPRAQDPLKVELHLVDGRVVTGEFVGLSLGAVAIGDLSFDRDEVAWIRFAGPEPADAEGDIGLAPVTRDYVLGRGGSVAEGILQSCTGASCRIGTTTVSDSVFIGLKREGPAPPQVQDPARGEIHFTSGEVKPAKLIGISSAKVVTDRGDYPRSDVAWVYVVQPSQSGPGPGYGGAPSPPAAPPGKAPPGNDINPPGTSALPPGGTSDPPPLPPPGGTIDPPPAPPAPPPPRRPPPSGGTGALWTGTIRGRYWGTVDGKTSELLVTVDVKLRETAPVPLYSPGTDTVIGRTVYLDPAGSTITNKLTASLPKGSCRGMGTTTHPGIAVDGKRSFLMTKTRNSDTRQLAGIDIPLGRTLYYVGYLGFVDEIAYECRASGATNTTQIGFSVPPLGNARGIGLENNDPEFRFLEGADTTVGTYRPGIMAGSYQARSLVVFTQMSAEWSICRAGTQCPPLPDGQPSAPPAEEDDEDDCNNASPSRALMDRLWDERKAKANQLETDYNAFDAAYKEHIDNVEGWRAAIDICSGIDISFEIVEELAGAFGKAADLVGKVANADPTYLVPYVDGAVWDDALRGFGELVAQAFPGDEVSGQLSAYRAKLASCSSSLPANVLASARAYLDSAAIAKRLQPLVQRQVNDIRNTDQKYWEEWQKNYRDCLQCARDKGLDAATCYAPPPQPAGPMPGESP